MIIWKFIKTFFKVAQEEKADQTEENNNENREEPQEKENQTEESNNENREESQEEKENKAEENNNESTEESQEEKENKAEENNNENREVSQEEKENRTEESNNESTEEPQENQNKISSLSKLRDVLCKIQKQKEENEIKSNEFLEKLKELPQFEDSEKSDGYSIDLSYDGEIPDALVKTIINKFLNTRFLKKDTTLNSRTNNSLEKVNGYYKWNYKELVKHLETEQYTKIPQDKYDYKYSSGENENIPLSFYFDLSGSMSNYTGFLVTVIIELIKKDVKVLIGYNKKINVQIESIKEIENTKDFETLINNFGEYSYGDNLNKDKLIKEKNVTYRIIKENIDDYLLKKKAEKCVIFSDFHVLKEICNLSNYTKIYWFCFEKNFRRKDLNNFNGFLYKTKDLNDILKGLIRVRERAFDHLCFINDENILMKKEQIK